MLLVFVKFTSKLRSCNPQLNGYICNVFRNSDNFAELEKKLNNPPSDNRRPQIPTKGRKII